MGLSGMVETDESEMQENDGGSCGCGQNERKPGVLVAVGWGLVVHVIGVYWWYSGEALWRPLVLFPPREIPPFWDAIFIIVVNGSRSDLVNYVVFVVVVVVVVVGIGGVMHDDGICEGVFRCGHVL